MSMLDDSIRIMSDRIRSVLGEYNPSAYIFGSATLGDFQFGWSDIDIIILTDVPLDNQKADELVTLRQTLTQEYSGNPYFRLFEGTILSRKAFFAKEKDIVVYWGTSGQRVIDTYEIDSFAEAELLGNGMLLFGQDILSGLNYPTHEQFKSDIRRHYDTIRRYGDNGCGWLLDIARGIYTLRTDKVIAKTKAGEWAIAENIAPSIEILKRAVEVRKNPIEYRNIAETRQWEKSLGTYIQKFANVLEAELTI